MAMLRRPGGRWHRGPARAGGTGRHHARRHRGQPGAAAAIAGAGGREAPRFVCPVRYPVARPGARGSGTVRARGDAPGGAATEPRNWSRPSARGPARPRPAGRRCGRPVRPPRPAELGQRHADAGHRHVDEGQALVLVEAHHRHLARHRDPGVAQRASSPNSWLRLPTPHAVGRGSRRSIRRPRVPAALLGGGRVPDAQRDPAGGAEPPGGGDPPVHRVDLGRPVDEHDPRGARGRPRSRRTAVPPPTSSMITSLPGSGPRRLT